MLSIEELFAPILWASDIVFIQKTTVILLGRPMYRANFVAVRVAQIRQVQLTGRAIPETRCVFTSCAAIGNARRMKRIALLG